MNHSSLPAKKNGEMGVIGMDLYGFILNITNRWGVLKSST